MIDTDDEFRDLLKTSTWGIGDEDFQAKVRDLHTDMTLKVKRKEDVSFRRIEPTVSAADVLDTVSRVFGVETERLRQRQYDCPARAVAAFLLGRCVGMNQRDIGVFLGMGTGGAVCRQLKRLGERRKNDRVLHEKMENIQASLLDNQENSS
jgi:hypothetical protein